MKAPLVLVVSKRMDANKKKDRNEDKLIRLGAKARSALGLADESNVELWPQGSDDDRINRSKHLEIYQAYSDELRELKKKVPQEEFIRIGFVTSRTFDYICKNSKKGKENIWIADTIEDTVIGADPEFVLVKDNNILVYANSVQGFDYHCELGSDGPLAEVRPKPAVDVSNLIKNIRKIFRTSKSAELIKQYQWISGCYIEGDIEGDPSHTHRGLGIGGHIHIGSPARLAREIARYADRSNGYRESNVYKDAVYSCLKKALDEYISIPMMRLDDKEESVKRRTRYGGFHDMRTDHGRLEYRTLSGEWFSHPDLARAVLGASKAVAHAFFKILDSKDYKKSAVMTPTQQRSPADNYKDFYFFDTSFSYWKNIWIMKELDTIKTSSVMTKILNGGGDEINLGSTYFRDLKTKMRKLPTYTEYSEHIDKFLEIVKLPVKALKKRDKELKHTWLKKTKFII